MEIAGYEIENKYLVAGAAGLGVIALLMRSQSGSDNENVAYLRPAEGLNWGDVIDSSDDAKLIGPGGPAGTPGPPGVPGTPGTPGTPGNGNNGGGNRECRRDRECPDGHVCERGKCKRQRDRDKVTGGRGDRDPRDGNRDNDRPNLPGRDDRDNDVRLDDPRRRRRREEGTNRINRDGNGNQSRPDIGDSTDRDIQRDRERERARGGRIRTGDLSGNFDLNARGGTERERGRNANANASGGRIRTGDINGPARGSIDVSGGRAEADASGGNGNRTGRDAKRAARQLFGRGGEAFSGTSESGVIDEGFGRQDGNNESIGFVRTNIQPGRITGGFMPMPQPFAAPGERAAIRDGESLKGFAKRTLGNEAHWPRIVRLNNDYNFGDNSILAGTEFRIG